MVLRRPASIYVIAPSKHTRFCAFGDWRSRPRVARHCLDLDQGATVRVLAQTTRYLVAYITDLGSVCFREGK